jgi:hypothetical protein
VNGDSKIDLKALFKGKGKYEDGKKNVNSNTQKLGKVMRSFYCDNLGHKTKFCRKWLWDEKTHKKSLFQRLIAKTIQRRQM